MSTWDGDDYQRRLEEKAAAGGDPHGEAAFVEAYRPDSVLDAGCGTGRVAIELARRGVRVVGVDRDPSMLATARRLDPAIDWIEADVAALALDEVFDVVVMAGNVPLFTPPGTTAALVAGCARHLATGGLLIAGFQLDTDYSDYTLGRYDDETVAAGLVLEDRYATWERDPFQPEAAYAVSVHRR